MTNPDRLTHYYRSVSAPFRSLTGLPADEVAGVLQSLATLEPLPLRLMTRHYLPRRRELEREMREQFVRKGGRPVLDSPHYLILGSFSLWEQTEGYRSVSIPIRDVNPDVLSFTYPDSWVSYVGEMLSREPLPRFPYHGQVFRLDELDDLIHDYGVPGERWQTEHQRRMETYIEAQIWDDAAVAAYRVF